MDGGGGVWVSVGVVSWSCVWGMWLWFLVFGFCVLVLVLVVGFCGV